MAASKAVALDTLVVDGLGLANQLRDEMAKEVEQFVAAGHRPNRRVARSACPHQPNCIVTLEQIE